MVQKKSLISNRATLKKAIVASKSQKPKAFSGIRPNALGGVPKPNALGGIPKPNALGGIPKPNALGGIPKP
jgi:hypothetical protein